MNEVRTMHLFAGVGGGLLADLILGHKPIVAVEWDKYACKVLRQRAADGWFPGLSVWEGDVRLFNPSEYAGNVDCIHAGFPCQDISTAGKQAGVGPETRSGLYREVLRIAGVVRPKQLFLENVSAIVTNGLGTVLSDLAALGYDSEWLCIRASDCGANHHRDRWFALCTRQPDVLSHSEHLRHGRRQQQSNGFEKTDDANTNGTQREGRGLPGRAYEKYANLGGCSWWEIEPKLGRVANGVPDRVGQLKGYGNAQVPLQAAAAYTILNNRRNT